MSDQPAFPESGLIEDLPPRQLLRGLFHLLFGREPVLSDDGAYVRELESGALSPRQLVEWLVDSAEWSHAAPMSEFGPSLHYGRGVFIRSLPRARRILDIGGAAVGDPSGALVLMGYPYRFDELTVVDLPSEDRHELYRDDARPVSTETPRGPVTYRYHSMTDLSSYPSQSFDMVYSGQSIEHVTRRQANSVLAQARRVLRPGGILALDTPNRRLTRLQQEALHRSRPQVRVHAPRDGRHAPGQRLRARARRRDQLRRRVGRPGGLRRRGARHQARRLRRDRGLLPAGLRVPAPDRTRAQGAGAPGPVAGGRAGGVRAARRRAAGRMSRKLGRSTETDPAYT